MIQEYLTGTAKNFLQKRKRSLSLFKQYDEQLNYEKEAFIDQTRVESSLISRGAPQKDIILAGERKAKIRTNMLRLEFFNKKKKESYQSEEKEVLVNARELLKINIDSGSNHQNVHFSELKKVTHPTSGVSGYESIDLAEQEESRVSLFLPVQANSWIYEGSFSIKRKNKKEDEK